MSEETTTTTTDATTEGAPVTAEAITKVVSGDSVYPIRDVGALRDADGSVAGTNIADGAVTEEKLASSVTDQIDALRDSVSQKASKAALANGRLSFEWQFGAGLNTGLVVLIDGSRVAFIGAGAIVS